MFKVKENVLKVLAGYVVLTLLTTLIMHEFSLRHTIFLLVDSMLLFGGAALYQVKRRYYAGIGMLLLVFGSIFLIRALTPTPIKVWEVDTFLSFIFALANIVLILLALIGKLAVRRGLSVVVLLALFLPVAVCWGYYFSEYSWLNVEAVMAVLQTNMSEALSYVKDKTSVGGYIASFLYIVLAVVCGRQISKAELKRGYISIYIGTAFFVILNIVLLVRTHDNFVWSIYSETKDYQANYDQFEKAREARKNRLVSAPELERDGEKGIYVLVIGESQNRKRMSAYGYGLPTTPWLESMKDNPQMLMFRNAYSCHVQTVPSLAYALTSKNQYNEEALECAVSLLEVAEAAGYDTVWLSNQVKTGSWGTPITVIAEDADQQVWLNTHSGNTLDTDYFDGELVKRFDSIKKSDRMLIVIHLMGDHISYHSRYPAEFDKFHDDGTNSEYDNSILYNDYVMQQLVEKLQAMPDFKGLVYFSDHSEGVNENQGHNASTFVFDMAYIPLYMYFSPSYMEENPDKIHMLREAQNYYFTNDLIFNTMLGVMDIRERRLYEPANDLTNPAYDNDRNRFLTMYGKRHISDDVTY